MNIFDSTRGQYHTVGKETQADCVIGHAFGTSCDAISVNRELSDFIEQHSEGKKVIVDRTLSTAFRDPKIIDCVTDTSMTTACGQGDGTWGTLLKAKEYMEQYQLTSPIMVAQASHIGRAVMQAKKIGIESIVLPGLPRSFDTRSQQYWTRSPLEWISREFIGCAVLRIQGKL